MDFLERIKVEKMQLEQLIGSLSFFINVAPEYQELSTKHKRLLCLQLEFMKAYLLILELRIEDIEKNQNSEVI